MRKLTSFHFISLDGVAESPDQYVRPELYADFDPLIGAAIAEQEAVLLGRQTYAEWAEIWPNSDIQPFADFINRVPKYVMSRSLTTADWPRSTVLSGALEAEIAQLRHSGEGTIGVHGSVRLTQSLLAAGLIDEMRLLLCPVIAGSGRRLLADDAPPVQLDLVSAQSTPRGLQHLIYRLRRA